MILEEGVENVFSRHHVVAEATRAALDSLGIRLFCEPDIFSDTLTAFNVPEGVKDSDVRAIMAKKYGVIISGGLEKLSGKIMRIGHMGETARPHYIRYTILALEAALADVGFKFERDAGLAAADVILKDIDASGDTSPL
jgi:aspartate aminotransferase-like enzyme